MRYAVCSILQPALEVCCIARQRVLLPFAMNNIANVTVSCLGRAVPKNTQGSAWRDIVSSPDIYKDAPSLQVSNFEIHSRRG